ncbi:carbohydrate ABC transporter permease [Aquibacillus salsiterrae]|uniref:Carbohydrate ABC transporter permease n=1 Tax=Aquibacillus salsiterrae TaxID=2950439 RepID=A0A9X4AHS8_9BACI|nr:carbohydrate ABC transporter permease [Aquibacillus salsiterrae]MDC3418538.1 carbohydrate ABC transporter permease [Aquibacillus salsiterrae]
MQINKEITTQLNRNTTKLSKTIRLGRKTKKTILNTITYILLITFSIYSLFPIVWAFLTAIKPKDEVMSSTPKLFTSSPTLENFRSVIFETQFPTYFLNSVIVSFGSVLLSIAIGVLAAYTLSRLNKAPGVKMLGLGMLFAQMVPVVLLMIPLYRIMMNMSLLDSYLGLIISYTVFAVPIITWMLKGFFDTIPIEIEESAMLDGCNKFILIVRIMIPLSVPAIVSAGIYALVHAWSEFVLTFTFVSDDTMRTLSTGVFNFMGLWIVDWGRLMAAAVLIVVPIAIVFTFIQKYLVSGLTAGSTKG